MLINVSYVEYFTGEMMDLYPVVICLDRGKKAGKFLRCGEGGTFSFCIFLRIVGRSCFDRGITT